MTKEEYIERWKKIDKKKIEQWEKIERKINPRPIPIVTEDKQVVCPKCGSKVYINPKVIPCRPPIFRYYCLKCKYRVNSRILIEEADELSEQDLVLYKRITKIVSEDKFDETVTGTSVGKI